MLISPGSRSWKHAHQFITLDSQPPRKRPSPLNRNAAFGPTPGSSRLRNDSLKTRRGRRRERFNLSFSGFSEIDDSIKIDKNQSKALGSGEKLRTEKRLVGWPSSKVFAEWGVWALKGVHTACLVRKHFCVCCHAITEVLACSVARANMTMVWKETKHFGPSAEQPSNLAHQLYWNGWYWGKVEERFLEKAAKDCGFEGLQIGFHSWKCFHFGFRNDWLLHW